MALHEQSVGATDEWYTPPYVFGGLGCRFEMDVASPGGEVTPWIPADYFITKQSAFQKWCGFVWMNPPFGKRNGLEPWLERFFAHANGIALVPDRTSAPWWQKYAPKAHTILFVRPKIKFIGADGKPGMSPAQGTCLLGIGPKARTPLIRAASKGMGVPMTTVWI